MDSSSSTTSMQGCQFASTIVCSKAPGRHQVQFDSGSGSVEKLRFVACLSPNCHIAIGWLLPTKRRRDRRRRGQRCDRCSSIVSLIALGMASGRRPRSRKPRASRASSRIPQGRSRSHG